MNFVKKGILVHYAMNAMFMGMFGTRNMFIGVIWNVLNVMNKKLLGISSISHLYCLLR